MAYAEGKEAVGQAFPNEPWANSLADAAPAAFSVPVSHALPTLPLPGLKKRRAFVLV
jgi:hypothetical protein